MRTTNIIYNSILTQVPLQSESKKIIDILRKNDIPSKMRRSFFILKYLDNEAKYRIAYRIYVDEIELSKAEEVFMSYLKGIENEVSSYYLYHLEDNELIDILLNPHIWEEFDIKHSKNILDKRKKITTEIEISLEDKLEKISNKEYYMFILIVTSIYLNLILLFLAPGFSFFGIFFGVQLVLGKIEVRKENVERIKKLHLRFQGLVLIFVSILHMIAEFWDIIYG